MEEADAVWQDLALQPSGAVEARVAALEGELARTQERVRQYEALADAAACGLVIARTPERFEYANPASVRLTGYAMPELLRLGVVGLAAPESRELLLDNFSRRLCGEVFPPYETVLRRRDGRPLPVEVSGALVDWHGEPATLVLIHDLTETHRSRDQLRAVNNALHAVLSIADELITCPDPDTLLRRAVELARERLGLERCSVHLVDGELMRGTYGSSLEGETTDERTHSYPAGDYWAHIRDNHPQGSRCTLWDQPYREWNHGAMDTLAGDGVTAATAICAGTEALGVFYNDNAITNRPLDPEAQEAVVLYCSLLGNMIQRQRAEQAVRQSELYFRQMADMLPDVIFETDAKQRLTYVNQAGFRTMRYDPADLERALRLVDFLTEDQTEALPGRLAAIAADDGGHPTSYHLRRGDGTLLPVEVSTIAVHGPDGELRGYRGVARDISERQRVEQSQRMAAVGELAATVAHDFGNILTSLKAWAQAAQRRRDEGTWEGLLQAVLHGCDRGSALCWNLMHLADPPTPRRNRIDLTTPLEAALSMATPELQRHEIEVVRHYACDPSSHALVMADPAQLEQVFLNLIVNACHAMPDGGCLTLDVEPIPDGGEVLARVTDSGTGIPVEHLHRIFEPFFSTRGGDMGGGGHGLGLFVSYGIVNSHGGTLTVQSEVGVGSCFEVRLAQCECG